MISLIKIFLYNDLLTDFVQNLIPAFQQRNNTNIAKTQWTPKKLSLSHFKEGFHQKLG